MLENFVVQEDIALIRSLAISRTTHQDGTQRVVNILLSLDIEWQGMS